MLRQIAKDKGGDYLPASQYQLSIDGVIATGSIKSVKGIEAEVAVIPYKDGDKLGKQYRPGSLNPGVIEITRGSIDDPSFYNWFQETAKGTTKRCTVAIMQYGRDGQLKRTYNFYEAWPKKYKGPDLDAEQDTYATETIWVVFERMEIVTA